MTVLRSSGRDRTPPLAARALPGPHFFLQAELPPPGFLEVSASVNALPLRSVGGGNSACKKRLGWEHLYGESGSNGPGRAIASKQKKAAKLVGQPRSSLRLVGGPGRTGEPEQVGPAVRSSGRRWSRPLLVATVLLEPVGSTLPDGRPSSELFHAGGVTPSLLPEGVKRSPTHKPQGSKGGGVTPPAIKKRGPGSARAARGGVLSRPDERSRVRIRRSPRARGSSPRRWSSDSSYPDPCRHPGCSSGRDGP